MYSFNKTPYYNNNRELPGLQFLKFICAILVVQLHSYSFLWSGLVPICRIAVLIFFFMSGYFMVSGIGVITSRRIVQIARKILRITIIANIVFLVFDILLKWKTDESMHCYFEPIYWIRLFVIGDSIWGHLWYLTSYLQTLLLIYIFLKFNKSHSLTTILLVAAFAGIILNLATGCYSSFFFEPDSPVLKWELGTFTLAIPGVAIGILLRVYEDCLPSQKFVLTSLIVSCALLYIEYMITGCWIWNLAASFPFAIFTFIFFSRLNPVSKISSTFVQLGKSQAVNIYLWHPMVIPVYIHFEWIWQIDREINSFVVIIITLAISIIFNPIENINKCLRHVRNTIPALRLR
ncbi:MAG: acyltransferase [Candidatus Amulumruptor caecigallinarius]|nr:acyltransferase [Candidatus Amulumruptor caecigallinarius]